MEEKSVKVGRNTFGLTFIIVGIVILLEIFLKQNVFRGAVLIWPVVLILLGSEILHFSHKKDVVITYDVVGIVLTILVVIFGSIFSCVNLVIAKISDSEIIKKSAEEYNFVTYFNVEDIELKIVNLSDDNIDVVIKEDEGLERTRVDFDVVTNTDEVSNLKVLFDGYDYTEFITTNSYDDNTIEIYNYPNWVKSVRMVIYTKDKDKIKCSGNITVK